MEEYSFDQSDIEQIEAERDEQADRERAEAAAKVTKEQEEAKQNVADELEDPRNADNWGFKAVTKELQSALTGGVQDSLSSVATFAERTTDALSGEMQREKEKNGYYKPQWDPFTSESNPIITKTWWGNLARGTVHFGTMAAGTVLAAKGLAAGGVGLGIGAGARALLGAPSLVRAAGIGAISDLVSKQSDGENALGMMRDRYGWVDTPLSTKETDHPIMMKVKNIVEGMGIGLVFDGAAMVLGKGGTQVQNFIKNRQKSVDQETLAKGLQELREGESGFRAAKNKPLAGPAQGATLSVDDPMIVFENQKKIKKDWGSEEGSAGNLITPVQRERGAKFSGQSEQVVEDVLRKLYSNNKFQALLDEVGGSRKALVEKFRDAVEAHQRITLGRSAADLGPDEYLEEFFNAVDAYQITDIDGNITDKLETLTSKYVVVADMVMGTLLQQVRDMAEAGREIKDFVDLKDVDGPLENIRDTMFMLLTEVKRARIIKSDNFRELGAGKRSYLEKTLAKEMADTREAIQAMLNITKENDPNGELLMSLFEAFSMMKTVNSVDDFDNFARKMIFGGEIGGKQVTGSLVKELQGVMTHSILSGPKTPARAIIGTATHTFLRPMATTIGAAFTGDKRAARAGLASMNAMIESIPESFELFRTRLNSYWSGDIATRKTRFTEYTKGDNNWEIIRRFAESDRANAGEKAAFRVANMARSMNDNKFLTYGVTLMAATDDAFAYILGRAKMREKALLSAFDVQDAGKLTAYSDINPELIKNFEDYFYSDIFDGNGNITDAATKFARQEVTLTQELTGFSRNLNAVFQQNPWAKPFFLFARTGVNGLKLTAKHTPGFNFLVKEWNDIAFADISNPRVFEDLAKYGITNERELLNARYLQRGRLAMGSALVFMAAQAWMRGDMTGNGPIDRQKRNVWIDAGYKPNSIKLGGVLVNYNSFEPFNQIMSMIADIGDASLLMGEEWTEDNLLKVGLLLAQGVTSKSYLAGLQSFVDLFGAKPGQGARIAANLMNNTIPLGGLRNDLGKLFQPYTRELNSGIIQSIRNRNKFFDTLPGNDLPIKYDILAPRPVNPYDFMTRAYNMFSPVQMNLDNSPGRELLFRSGYDMRLSVLFSPDGDDLTKEPVLRSKFQQAIGKQNLEVDLIKLSKDPRIIASIEQMDKDRAAGNRADFEPMDYYHNKVIRRLFARAERIAWAEVSGDARAQEIRKERLEKKIQRQEKGRQSGNILNIYK